MNKYGKQFYVIIFFMFAASFCFTQANGEMGFADVNSAAKEKPENLPITISKFKVDAHYYGLPLTGRMGWFYRKDDFSIYPNAALSFFLNDGPVLNTSAGLVLQKKYFTWAADAVYDIVPFTMNKPVNRQIFYGTNNFLFTVHGVKIAFPTIAGRRRRTAIDTVSGQTEYKKTVVTEITQGIACSFFLADMGFFKSTGNASLEIDWIPKENFADYRIYATVLASFFLYHADIVFSYSLFNTDYIKLNKTGVKQNYEIAKTQELLTARSSFKPQTGFTQMHVFGTEMRWYPARIQTQSNGFFLSLFTDIGFGFTKENKLELIAEYGLGGGYTLLDSVPFTFQVGLNQRFQPVFYLGVVSRLTHLP
ncbi:hypothetical protein [Treponema pedis]|uniref:hypothetical protein n=1 Tax=Treponema pedis TaxID=409322 RepID=UPI000416895A|nr:hypothetical protein [Treponema pedis]